MHVGGAAAEVGLEAVEVGVGPIVRVDMLTFSRADDLIGLLVVLVGCHIFLEGGGQRVECEAFEAVAVGGVAVDGCREGEAIHGFGDGAELGALRGGAAGVVFVAGEDAGALAVEFVEFREGELSELEVVFLAREQVANGAELEGHSVVDAVVIEAELGGFLGVFCFERVEVGGPVVGLVEGFLGDGEERGVVGFFVEPEEGRGEVGGAVMRPAIKGFFRDDLINFLRAFLEGGDDAGVAGGFLVLGEGFEEWEEGPDVVGFVARVVVANGAEPTVGLLVVEDVVDGFFDLGLESVVVELIGERNEAIEPVWDAFPAFGGAAEPGGIFDIGPEFVEVAGECVGLGAELSFEPACWLDGGGGEGLEGARVPLCWVLGSWG